MNMVYGYGYDYPQPYGGEMDVIKGKGKGVHFDSKRVGKWTINQNNEKKDKNSRER